MATIESIDLDDARSVLEELSEQPWLAYPYVRGTSSGSGTDCPVARYLNEKVPSGNWRVLPLRVNVIGSIVGVRVPYRLTVVITDYDNTKEWPRPPGLRRWIFGTKGKGRL